MWVNFICRTGTFEKLQYKYQHNIHKTETQPYDLKTLCLLTGFILFTHLNLQDTLQAIIKYRKTFMNVLFKMFKHFY